MYFPPRVDLLLYYLMIGFYIFPIFIILSVLVFPRFYKKPNAVDEVAEVPLLLTSLHIFIFIIFLFLKWFYSPDVVKYRIRGTTHTDVFRHKVEFFSEYDTFILLIDSLNIPLIILNLILAFTAIYYAGFSTSSIPLIQKAVINVTLVTFLVNILLATLHLGLFYIAFELLIIPLFFLISMGSRLRRLRAITLFVLYTMTFSYIMLFGLIYAWVWIGTLNYGHLLNHFHYLPIVPVQIFWVSLLIAFLAKIPLVPFHIWLPEAHVEATAIGSVLLAGIILKIGTYGILRFLLPLHGLLNSETLFVWIGLGSLVSAAYATLMTLVQVDFKRVIAYSSIAHLSFAVAAIFTGTKIGVVGSYYYNIGHGFVSAGLFFLAGIFYARYGTRLLKYYSGLRMYPFLGAFFMLYSFANIGFPGTVNFVAELLVVNSFIFTNSIIAIILVFFTFFGSLVFSIWTYLRMANGPISFHTLQEHDDIVNYDEISLVGPPSLSRRRKPVPTSWMPTTKMEIDIFSALTVPLLLLGVFPHDAFFSFIKLI